MSDQPQQATKAARRFGVLALLGISSHLLLRFVIAIISLGLLLLIFTLFVLGTPQGSAWVARTLTDFSGGKVQATGVSGTLLAGLDLERFDVNTDTVQVSIAPAGLRMHWPDLLRGRLRLTTARADAVTIVLRPRPEHEPDEPVAALRLPLAIVVDGLQIGRLTIRTVPAAGDEAGASAVEIGPIALRGDLTNGVIRFDRLQVQLYGLNVEAAGRFGTGEPFALASQLRWRMPAAAISGAGSVAGDLGDLQFGQVVELPSAVQVAGRIHLLGDQPRLDATARWTDLEQALMADDPRFVLQSSSGELQLRGWTDDLSIRLNGRIALGADAIKGNGGRSAALAVRAHGDLEHLDLQRIALDGFGGELRGTGRVQFRNPAALQLQLQGMNINPGFIDPRFDGQLSFAAALSGDATGNFRVQVPEAGGRLFDRQFKAAGTVAREGQRLTLDQVRVSSGVNRLAASGQWGPRVSGTFAIDAPDLATLWPGLKGELRGSGSAAGTAQEPQLDIELEGHRVGYDDLQIETLRVRGSRDCRAHQQLDLSADNLRWSGSAVGNLAAELDGTPANHDLHASLTGGDVAFEFRATGAWQAGGLALRFARASVQVGDTRTWSLQEPATLRVAGRNVTLSAHCWIGQGELCVADSRLDAEGIEAGLRLQAFPLATFSPWLPADLEGDGTATACVAIAGTVGRYIGHLQGRLDEAALRWRTQDDEEVETTFSEFKVEVDLADALLQFDARLAESFGLHLSARGTVTTPFGANPTVDARITGGVPDLASLGPVLERFVDIADLKGVLGVDATLSGNARRPDIAGGVELDQGAFTVPVAGITVDRIALALRGRPDGQLVATGNARSGKGFVALDGSLAWRDQLMPTGDATIKGRLFDVIRLPQGLVQVSPDAQVRLRDGQFRISGEVLVPRAEIKLKKLEESGVEPSEDTVVHGRTELAVERKPPLFMLDGLQVRLGEQVSFDGFGLKTRLVGGLRLSQSLGADPRLVSGAGIVTLQDGLFTVFGQKLAIDRGSLLFSGVVTDPGLDVKASRAVTYQGRDVTVGVLLSGTVSRIITRIFSEPAMGELDALSYLTTGKPLSASSVGDRSAVANAAVSLGLSQALPVAQKLGSALNVDEIGLDTTDSGGTAVVVGERLGNDLFIRYSYGVFDQIGTIKVTYRLSKRLSLEASSGNEQSLDLIYSVNW